MKKIIIILFSITFIGCKQNSKAEKLEIDNKLVSEKDIYEIINFIIGPKTSEDSFYTNYIVFDEMMKFENEKNDYLGINEMDSIFSKEDKIFIKKQHCYPKV